MDYKDYKAQDGAMFVKAMVWLFIAIFFAATAYTSTKDIETCLEEKQSVYLCGAGNNK